MGKDKNSLEKINTIAQEVLQLSRNNMVVNLRFMDVAISRLQLEAGGPSLMTDGMKIYYNPRFVLKEYKKAKEIPARFYLHTMLHCIFQHFYIDPFLDRNCWDLACDMMVEHIINELDLNCTRVEWQQNQEVEIARVKEKESMITAEKIYHYLREGGMSQRQITNLYGLFRADDHDSWYDVTIIAGINQTQAGNDSDEAGTNANQGKESNSFNLLGNMIELRADWQDIARRMQTDLETYSKRKGDQAGDMLQGLRVLNREKYDYSEFLKKFMTMGEIMKVNEDEFDYIFYTYGLSTYKKMPLIEPLEYKETKRIKEFVIAIDTSGSTSGELVQKFLEKTYNIMLQQENFFSKINLHIIQCDADIQEDAKITNQDEFNQYIKNLKIHGLGGTDFRPVFTYVNQMIENREFTDLKGLIYFTDGYGDFPQKQPDYHTAFVFIEDECNNLDVPVWAIKLILQSEDINNFSKR